MWCSFIVLEGVETETLYGIDGEHLAGIGERQRPAVSVSGVAPHDDIHRVCNTGDTVAITLHVYGPDLIRGASVAEDGTRPMRSGSGELFDQGLDFFTTIIIRLSEDDWERPTPCAGWTVHDVLGHLATTIRSGISTMQGQQPTWPDAARPGDLVEGDPVEFWRGIVVQARDVLRNADLARVMETPLGRTVADDLAIPVIDLYVHAWDLGAAVGIAVQIPADVIDFAHAYIDPLPDDMVRGDNRAFGPQIPVPAGATPTERFIAWTGRRLPQ